MASSIQKPAAAALLQQLRRRPPRTPPSSRSWLAAAGPSSATTRAMSSSTHGDGDGAEGGMVRDPPPGMAPLPEDAPRQTPPRLGETDPAGPPVATTSEDKMGGALKEGEAPEGIPDTTPPPDVPLPPASPPGGGSNV
ncbi:hypothetical protein EJB05_50295, partial [Eragrostis curvula]